LASKFCDWSHEFDAGTMSVVPRELARVMNAHDLALARLAETNHGVFSAAEARACGLTSAQCAYRVRNGYWIAIHDCVYRLAGAALSSRGALAAACLASGPDSVVSHRSAALLWDLPGARDDIVEITGVRGSRSRHSGLLVHESKMLRSDDRTVRDRVPTTTAARTLVDLGAVCSPAVVEMALDRALRRELTSLGELRDLLDAVGKRGRAGVGTLRALVDGRDPRSAPTESEMETLLRRVLRRHGLPEPVPQYVIRDGARFVARVDFAYPDRRIAVEYDSLDHHMGRRAHIRDNARRNQIVALDWALVVATVEDVRRGGDALARAIHSRFGVEFRRRSA
jgi:hypothetical protein